MDNIILELRSAEGGDDAKLFVEDMYVMYSKFCRRRKQAAEAETSQERKAQVGSGMRGDKIRTYNYRENRITDHRTGKSTRRLKEVVEQGRLELIW